MATSPPCSLLPETPPFLVPFSRGSDYKSSVFLHFPVQRCFAAIHASSGYRTEYQPVFSTLDVSTLDISTTDEDDEHDI
uniref:Uncharacterized protein n=1 Tax=Globodera rostochiensis TaxID=31243 RepID=A0A914HIC7_GLORO